MENKTFKQLHPLGLDISAKNQTNQEKLDVKIEIATENDIDALKKLRLKAISGADAPKFGTTFQSRIKEKLRTREQWKEEFIGDNIFTLKASVNSEIVGMGKATARTKDWWHVGWLYVDEDYKRQHIGRTLTASRLREIIRRGGIKASGFIKNDNVQNLGNSGFFGYQKVDTNSTDYPEQAKFNAKKFGFSIFEVDLKDPEVIKKINKALNAG